MGKGSSLMESQKMFCKCVAIARALVAVPHLRLGRVNDRGAMSDNGAKVQKRCSRDTRSREDGIGQRCQAGERGGCGGAADSVQ